MGGLEVAIVGISIYTSGILQMLQIRPFYFFQRAHFLAYHCLCLRPRDTEFPSSLSLKAFVQTIPGPLAYLGRNIITQYPKLVSHIISVSSPHCCQSYHSKTQISSNMQSLNFNMTFKVLLNRPQLFFYLLLS